MNSRQMFRESGHVIRTIRRDGSGIGFAVLAVLTLVALYGSLDWLDERAAAKSERNKSQAEAALKEVYDTGRLDGRAEMLDSARAVWEAALQEGKDRCARSKQ